MTLLRVIVWSAALSLLARDATTQTLALRIENGLVTLDADNVPVADILARWTELTGLNVLTTNGVPPRVAVTVKVAGISEREALQTVLRDSSGYIMGERRNPLTGAVTIDRLLILPSSASAAVPVNAPSVIRPQQPFVRRGRTASGDVEMPVPAPAPPDVEATFELTPAVPIADAPPAVAAPSSPFGNSRGAARPGVMTPPPEAPPAPPTTRQGPPPGAPQQPAPNDGAPAPNPAP
jgi:hypothetical protein